MIPPTTGPTCGRWWSEELSPDKFPSVGEACDAPPSEYENVSLLCVSPVVEPTVGAAVPVDSKLSNGTQLDKMQMLRRRHDHATYRRLSQLALCRIHQAVKQVEYVRSQRVCCAHPASLYWYKRPFGYSRPFGNGMRETASASAIPSLM